VLLGDNDGALKSFAWFEKKFPDDIGEPMNYLCWTLALYRAGEMKAAEGKFQQTMLSNLYLLPTLLGREQAVLAIWHGSNFQEKSYVDDVPPELFELWDKPALQWAAEKYEQDDMRTVRERYIAIYQQLATEPPGPKRSQLVQEASKLERGQMDLN
jgi:hypothetical protein